MEEGDWIFNFTDAYGEIQKIFNSNSKVQLQIVRHGHYGKSKRKYSSK